MGKTLFSKNVLTPPQATSVVVDVLFLLVVARVVKQSVSSLYFSSCFSALNVLHIFPNAQVTSNKMVHKKLQYSLDLAHFVRHHEKVL